MQILVILKVYRTAQNFDDGGNIDEFDESLAIRQNFTFLPCKADIIRQTFACQIFPNPQFVKIFHHQNFVPYSIFTNHNHKPLATDGTYIISRVIHYTQY